MKTPESIVEHADKYKDHSWEQYTPEQLAHWAINLTIRASHRKETPDQIDKIKKDIQDAKNYLDMLSAWMEHTHKEVATSTSQ